MSPFVCLLSALYLHVLVDEREEVGTLFAVAR
jgi:hypothetical protein